MLRLVTKYVEEPWLAVPAPDIPDTLRDCLTPSILQEKIFAIWLDKLDCENDQGKNVKMGCEQRSTHYIDMIFKADNSSLHVEDLKI